MGKKVISFGLSESDIDRALKELEQYKQEIRKKTELLREKVAQRLADEADMGFAQAVSDTIISAGGTVTELHSQVDVSVDNRGSVSVVIASGEDAVWIEFGSGVFYNGSPGTSPHPSGAELGFVIGGYGDGNGKKKVWGYKDETGKLILTHGTPAAMPMSKAITTVCNEISNIAKEVFG